MTIRERLQALLDGKALEGIGTTGPIRIVGNNILQVKINNKWEDCHRDDVSRVINPYHIYTIYEELKPVERPDAPRLSPAQCGYENDNELRKFGEKILSYIDAKFDELRKEIKK